MQSEGAHVDGYADWYAPKQEEMRADELLRFVHDARIEDFHKGRHALWFPRTHVETLGSGEPPMSAPIRASPDGVFWVIDEATPTERRVPYRGGRGTTEVRLENPPRSHRGQELSADVSPIELGHLALAYLEELVFEARGRFPELQPENTVEAPR